MSPLTPYLAWIKLGAYALVLAIAAWCAWKAYGWAYDNGFAAANVRAETVIREFAQAEAAAQAKARAAERGKAEALAAADTAYQQGLTDAKQAAADTVAGLRAGNLELRDHWQGCINRLPGTAPGAGEPDAADELRAASAGRIVQIVAECQAQRDGLQAVTAADRAP